MMIKMNESFIVTVCILAIFLIMSVFSFWILKRKEPMHFYTGSKVDSNTITDIKKYNRANAIMWFLFGAMYLLALPFILFGYLDAALIFLFVISFGGCFSLPRIYNYIRVKYQHK